jgi:hypothetical protein
MQGIHIIHQLYINFLIIQQNFWKWLITATSCYIILHSTKFLKLINLTHMISILNSVFTVMFYTTRWTKLDINCISFEELINQLNSLYICIYLYLQLNRSYVTHKLGRGPKFFVRPSLVQWAASEIFISFYVSILVLFFYAPMICIYFELQKDSSSFLLICKVSTSFTNCQLPHHPIIDKSPLHHAT